jgi:hypothetical protein
MNDTIFIIRRNYRAVNGGMVAIPSRSVPAGK